MKSETKKLNKTCAVRERSDAFGFFASAFILRSELSLTSGTEIIIYRIKTSSKCQEQERDVKHVLTQLSVPQQSHHRLRGVGLLLLSFG